MEISWLPGLELGNEAYRLIGNRSHAKRKLSGSCRRQAEALYDSRWVEEDALIFASAAAENSSETLPEMVMGSSL